MPRILAGSLRAPAPVRRVAVERPHQPGAQGQLSPHTLPTSLTQVLSQPVEQQYESTAQIDATQESQLLLR